MTTFELLLPPTGDIDEMTASWVAAERDGWDALWVPDHSANPSNPPRAWFDCWQLLAAMAVTTSSVRIGSLVSSPEMREPRALARAALTTQALSHGRLALGVGAGRGGAANFAAFARSVSTGLNEATAAGATTPRLLIASQGNPTTLRAVAQYGDAWNITISDTPFAEEETLREATDRVRVAAATLEYLCREEGRDPAAIERTVLVGRTVGGVNPWSDPPFFRECVEALAALGFRNLVFYRRAVKDAPPEAASAIMDEHFRAARSPS